MPEPINKRAYPRFQVPKAVLCYKSETCPVLNLGKGGLAFSTSNCVRLGQKLNVLLTFSEKDAPVRLCGRAVYCLPDFVAGNRYAVGIRFEPFSSGAGSNTSEFFKILEELEHENVTRRSRPASRQRPPAVKGDS